MKWLIYFFSWLPILECRAQIVDSFWYSNAQRRNTELSLPAVTSSSHPFHFRLHDGGRILDSWTDTTGKVYAQLLHWVGEVVPKGEVPTERLYRVLIPLPDSTAKNILSWYMSSGIAEVPTQDCIEGWESGLDGVEYLLELRIHPVNYLFKI